ncbi:MAG: tagatose-bisphosphate aldolase [Gemmataceae bacterium]
MTQDPAKSSVIRLLSIGLTPGKVRGLQRISNANGTLTMVALDQNSSMINMMRDSFKKTGQDREPSYEEIVEAKLELTRALAPHASAVLLDAYYGAWNALASGCLPRQTGLLVRLEKSGGPKNAVGAPLTEIEPGWSVLKIKNMGADAVKLLVPFEPEEWDSAEKQLALVQQVHEECRRLDILLLLETVSFPYRRNGLVEDKKSATYLARKGRTVIETARLLSRYCDVYKAEFPGTLGHDPEDRLLENLHRLDEACVRPWVLLSAGVDFPDYRKQVEMALRAGASGVLGGRAFWKEYFTFASTEDRQRFVRQEATTRVRQIHDLVCERGRPWFSRYGLKADDFAGMRAVEGWHFRYGEYRQSLQHAPPAPGDVY